MRPAVALVAFTLAAGCSNSPDARSPIVDDTRTRPETTNVPAVEPGSTPEDGTLTCLDDTPVEPARIGTVNTIVVPANSSNFAGTVTATPTAVCPGDEVTFTVSIVNVADAPSVFEPGRGLLFLSGGQSKWSLATLPALRTSLESGDRIEQTISGTIPPVAPGTYRLSPEGSTVFGEIDVLDPTAD